MNCPYCTDRSLSWTSTGRAECPGCGRIYSGSEEETFPILHEVGRRPLVEGSPALVRVALVVRYRGGGRSARLFTDWIVARRERERLCARILEEDAGSPIVDFHFCVGERLLFSVEEIASVEVTE